MALFIVRLGSSYAQTATQTRDSIQPKSHHGAVGGAELNEGVLILGAEPNGQHGTAHSIGQTPHTLIAELTAHT
jgi:hypothetical protein